MARDLDPEECGPQLSDDPGRPIQRLIRPSCAALTDVANRNLDAAYRYATIYAQWGNRAKALE
jgi:hypothetical protein